VPVVTQIPPGATVGFCYRVQSGETLYSLAKKFGVSPAYLSLVNDLYPPDYVFVHQPLFIPEQAGRGPNVIIVKPGDSLASIADGCKLTASMIAKANDLAADAALQPGHVLIIPIPPFPPPARFAYPPPGVW
jgi:spore germination protein